MSQKEIDAASAGADEAPTSTTAKASSSPKTGSRKPATIGSSIVIHGDVTGEEDLVVDGSIEGTVNFKDNNLVVSENGRVTANINARIIRVDGQVNGELYGSEQVIISPSGRSKAISAPRVLSWKMAAALKVPLIWTPRMRPLGIERRRLAFVQRPRVQ